MFVFCRSVAALSIGFIIILLSLSHSFANLSSNDEDQIKKICRELTCNDRFEKVIKNIFESNNYLAVPDSSRWGSTWGVSNSSNEAIRICNIHRKETKDCVVILHGSKIKNKRLEAAIKKFKTEIINLGGLSLCMKAMNIEGNGFKDINGSDGAFVREAFYRGFSSYSCKNLISSEHEPASKLVFCKDENGYTYNKYEDFNHYGVSGPNCGKGETKISINEYCESGTMGWGKISAVTDVDFICMDKEERILAEEKRIAEEKRKEEEKKQIAEEKRKEEERRIIEEKKREELARLEAEKEFKKKNDPKQMGSGSGFYVNDKGYIASNFHVTDGCIEVRLGKEKLEIVRNDIVNDIAIMKSNQSGNPYIKIAKDGAMKGEDVFVIGFPHGKHLSSESKVTKGVVSALQGLGNNYSQMQIDAAIQPGNSGGPVINSDGELIGVTVATADYEVMFDMFKSLPQNMNFAIKSQMLTNILDGSKIAYETPQSSWFSFGSEDAKDTIAEVDKATVYLECWSTEIAMKEAKESAAKLVDTVNSN